MKLTFLLISSASRTYATILKQMHNLFTESCFFFLLLITFHTFPTFATEQYCDLSLYRVVILRLKYLFLWCLLAVAYEPNPKYFLFAFLISDLLFSNSEAVFSFVFPFLLGELLLNIKIGYLYIINCVFQLKLILLFINHTIKVIQIHNIYLCCLTFRELWISRIISKQKCYHILF